MTNFYLKGLSTTKLELEGLREKFLSRDMDLMPIYDDYSKVFNNTEKEIQDEIVSFIGINSDINSPVNLICHSMGCNLGVSVANKIPNLDHLILISPEFERVSKEEQRRILSEYPKQDEDNTKMTLQKIKGIILFLRSKKWASQGIINLIVDNGKMSLIHSKGDQFVSHDYLHHLVNSADNFNEYEVDGSMHNPLNNDDNIEIVRRILKK